MEFGLYRELVAVARPLFEAEDWSRLKGLLREGISKGAYGVDQHGVPTLERCIRTGIVIVEKTGLKRASLLTALFDPMVQQGLIAPEQFKEQFGEDAAQECIKRVRQGLTDRISGDFLSQDIRQCIHHLSTITGDITTDDILGNIFKHFCIGK